MVREHKKDPGLDLGTQKGHSGRTGQIWFKPGVYYSYLSMLISLFSSLYHGYIKR